MPNTMYQVSTLQALMMGDYEGHISIRALLKKAIQGSAPLTVFTEK